MTTPPFDPIFRQSCVDIHKADCETNTRLIDPCTCKTYFRCVNNDMILSYCSPGTAYDHTVDTTSSTFCKLQSDIYLHGICSSETPWVRCKTVSNITDSQLSQIQVRCSGRPLTTSLPAGSGSDSDVGGIVGGVIAGILILLFLVIGYILYRRGYTPSFSFKKKQMKSKHPLHNQPSIHNPEYFSESGQTDHQIYEEYSTIDDSMHDPQYSREAPRLPYRPPPGQSNTTGTGDRKMSVTSVQTYTEPTPSLKYGFNNMALEISEAHSSSTNNNDDRYYTELLPDIPSNGHAHLHNRMDDNISPYDNSLHV